MRATSGLMVGLVAMTILDTRPDEFVPAEPSPFAVVAISLPHLASADGGEVAWRGHQLTIKVTASVTRHSVTRPS